MDSVTPLFLALVGMALLAVVYWVVTHFYSEEANLKRRRRRSNSPIAKKRNGPSVKLCVRTKKERRK